MNKRLYILSMYMSFPSEMTPTSPCICSVICVTKRRLPLPCKMTYEMPKHPKTDKAVCPRQTFV